MRAALPLPLCLLCLARAALPACPHLTSRPPLAARHPVPSPPQEEEEKPAAKKQKAADGSAVDVSAANGSRTIFIKNLAWAADEVRAALRCVLRCVLL